MSKCPYCQKELFIEIFFEVSTKESKKGKTKVKIKGFKGESHETSWHGYKMWTCPSCDSILGFSEYSFSSST